MIRADFVTEEGDLICHWGLHQIPGLGEEILVPDPTYREDPQWYRVMKRTWAIKDGLQSVELIVTEVKK